MKDFILKVYNDYQTYMNLDKNLMPLLNPINLDNNFDNNTPLMYVISDELTSSIVNLYINPIIYTYNKRFQIAKLYHEFTHILDAQIFSNEFKNKNFEHIMSTYSEYHASQVELSYNLNFRNIYSFRKINPDKTLIDYENEKISATYDYLKVMSDALIIIEKPSDAYYNLNYVEYYRKYSLFEAKTMYYLGKENLCSKVTYNRPVNITDKEYGKFAPFIRDIEQSIKQKDYKEIINARIKLWQFYTSFFTCKQKYLFHKEP